MARNARLVFSQPGAFRLYTAAELLALPPPTFLIERVLPEGGFSVLYGASGTFKTFVALDMALCVATGRPWHGHAVQQGFVIYISAEGGRGISRRVAAWLEGNGLTLADLGFQIGFVLEAISIHDDSDVIQIIRDRIEEVDALPALVVVDTLARCLQGDENAQEDMGRFIRGLDRLREACGATFLVVHHTSLGDRERGSTALRAGSEAMLKVSREDRIITLENNKQKDAPESPAILLRLAVSTHTESAYVVHETVQGEDDMLRLQDLLDQHGPLAYSQWLQVSQMPKIRFNRARLRLVESGQILKENDKYALLGSLGRIAHEPT